MDFTWADAGLVALSCFVISFVFWRPTSRARTLVALLLLAILVFAVGRMAVVGRPVVAGVIERGGPVAEVSEAIRTLRDFQVRPMVVVLIAGIGLFALTILRRPGGRDR